MGGIFSNSRPVAQSCIRFQVIRAGGVDQEAAASFRTRSASQVRGQVTQVSSGRRV